MRAFLIAVLLAACGLLAGCAASPWGYYWQTARGHWQLLRSAEPIDHWLARGDLPAALRERLQLAQQVRAFASTDLALPDNASYRRYADLRRRAAVWNVVAAPPDALVLHQWCFAVVGCVGYRGHFDEGAARAEAARLAAQGLEVHVYGVPAYSTLGYSNWLGGDPLLNTFIHWPEGDFVALLVHELAHQVLYVAGDTAFNEAFATAVERLGTQQWLATHATPAARAEYAASQARRTAWRQLLRGTRARLERVYAGPPEAVAAGKAAALQALRSDYGALRAQWASAAQPPTPAQLQAYDRWVAEANNAALALQGAYEEWVPAFAALHARSAGPQGDWRQFYDAVRALAARPEAERRAALCALHPAPPENDCARHPHPPPA